MNLLIYCIKEIKNENVLVEVVRILIEEGIDLDYKDEDGRTALMVASRYGRDRVVQILVDNGCDLNIQDNDGFNALMIAFLYRDFDATVFLIENGADPSSLKFLLFEQYKAIHVATRENDIAKVQLCLDLGMNVDEVTLETKRSALYYATKREYTDIIELLIVSGADIYLDDEPRDDRYQFSPLRLAIRNHYDLDILKLFELSPMFDPYYILLDPWVNINYLKYFLKGDIDINTQNQCGGTMLHNAVFQKNEEKINYLLKMGARTDIVDDYGNTAMNVNTICW